MAELRALKKALRLKMAKVLKETLTEEQIRAETRAVFEKVLQHEWYQKANKLSVYVGTTGEIGTDDLIKHALRSGKTVCIPFFQKGVSQMKMVKLIDEADFEQLDASLWGIRQHHPSRVQLDESQRKEEEETNRFDLIVAPGVAFTRSGKRLGHGMGYYDRFLNAQCEKFGGERPRTMALALRAQILADEEELPVDPERDWIMDLVLSAD